MIYDANQIQNQESVLCGNAIIINDESSKNFDGLSIIGPNIGKCGNIPFKTIRKENNHHKTI